MEVDILYMFEVMNKNFRIFFLLIISVLRIK